MSPRKAPSLVVREQEREGRIFRALLEGPEGSLKQAQAYFKQEQGSADSARIWNSHTLHQMQDYGLNIQILGYVQ